MKPTRAVQVTNALVFQVAWFAAVLGAAYRMPLAGTLVVLAAIGWHIGVSTRPRREGMLIAIVILIGTTVETVNAATGLVVYPSGQPDPRLPPYWLVSLWGLLGIALNVTLRWLRRRPWLTALLGAMTGPLSFVGGVRLGGAQFIDPAPAVLMMAATWALLLPALIRLSIRFDGVTVPETSHA